jgi:hypothetical protein
MSTPATRICNTLNIIQLLLVMPVGSTPMVTRSEMLYSGRGGTGRPFLVCIPAVCVLSSCTLPKFVSQAADFHQLEVAIICLQHGVVAWPLL